MISARWHIDASSGRGEYRKTQLIVPSNYPAYYAAVRDALLGKIENPVPARQAIAVMELIELEIESARHHATLTLRE